MIETDRVLRPLREAEDAIDQLDTYESPAVLTEALRATWHAVDRTLRSLLRSDATAPDSVRLTAMSPDLMPSDAVLLELRRRDLVSLDMAGRVHELRQAVARAAEGTVRAADADNAREVVRRLEAEVDRAAAARSGSVAAQDEPAPRAEPASTHGGLDDVDDPANHRETAGAHAGPAAAGAATTSARPSGLGRWPAEMRRPLAVVLATVLLLAAAAAAVVLLSDSSDLEEGIAAFGDGRQGDAEQHFRAVLQDEPGNNTARLYLARILRREERHQEAAQLLQAAAASDPEDAGVRRELGYLFLDLGRPGSAAAQFRRAVELDAADPLNWAGVVHALREAGDTSEAAEWLRRAPAAAREMMRTP